MNAWLERPVRVRIGIIASVLLAGLLLGLLLGYYLGYRHGSMDMLLLEQM